MTRPIPAIDKDIDANWRAALARERITNTQRNRMSASDWQALRDRNPDFDHRDHQLFRERGFAQLERDEKAYKAAMALSRKSRATARKRCPACHQLVA